MLQKHYADQFFSATVRDMAQDNGKIVSASSAIDVAYVAHLARLELSEAEKTKISAQLRDILGYVAKLSEVDVTGVEPTAHAVPLSNVLRPDEVRPSLDTGRVLQNAPESSRDLFIVPKIVE
jgi:aspartyl-tRNA(Asn)/glutamyl-tRNA(Gln) amidotransferase subunit C